VLVYLADPAAPVVVFDDGWQLGGARGAQGLGAGGPARDHKPPLNICQASQNPCRSLGKALSEFLESISRTQHRTILPMPPDQHHADGQSSGHTCWDTDRGMASDVEGASIG